MGNVYSGSDPKNKLRVREVDGTPNVFPVNTIVVHTILLPPERQDETVRGQAERLLAKAWAPVEAAIEGREYLIGDFSAADTMLGHACIMSKRLGIVTDETFPNLNAYADRLMTRPACAKAFSA